MSLCLVDYIFNQSNSNFGVISNSIEILLVGQGARIVFQVIAARMICTVHWPNELEKEKYITVKYSNDTLLGNIGYNHGAQMHF